MAETEFPINSWRIITKPYIPDEWKDKLFISIDLDNNPGLLGKFSTCNFSIRSDYEHKDLRALNETQNELKEINKESGM